MEMGYLIVILKSINLLKKEKIGLVTTVRPPNRFGTFKQIEMIMLRV